MEEIWKDIKGLEKWFEVSNKGRIRSKDRIVRSGKGWHREIKGGILKTRTQANGYKAAHLRVSEIGYDRTTVLVHRLVAEAFIPNPNNYPCVNHKDEDKTNNCVENLEWCTVAMNNSYGTRVEKVLKKQRYGNKHFSGTAIAEIDGNGNLIKAWRSMSDIKRAYGMNIQAVHANCNGITKATKSGKRFMYISEYEITNGCKIEESFFEPTTNPKKKKKENA